MTGKPLGMPIAHPVPFLRRGEEDVGATVVGVVDALHPGPTDHPLAIGQRTGLGLERVREIASAVLHTGDGEQR